MKEKLRRDIKHLSQSKDPSATTELMEVSTKYDEYMGVLDEVGVEAIKQGESNYPEYIHAEMYNNTYHVHYKYISCDISKTELSRFKRRPTQLLAVIILTWKKLYIDMMPGFFRELCNNITI